MRNIKTHLNTVRISLNAGYNLHEYYLVSVRINFAPVSRDRFSFHILFTDTLTRMYARNNNNSMLYVIVLNPKAHGTHTIVRVLFPFTGNGKKLRFYTHHFPHVWKRTTRSSVS